MPEAEFTWYTDESSFIKDGKRYAAVAVVMDREDILVESLPPGTSA